MQTLQFIIFIGVLLIAAFLLWHGTKKAEVKKLQRLADRDSISAEEFYLKYYVNTDLPKNNVISLLEEIAIATEIPKEKIRPNDRFSLELAPEKGWELDDGLFLFLAKWKKLLAKNNLAIDFNSINTVDDFIRGVGRYDLHS